MRKSKVKNKYKLTFPDIQKLKINNRNKICDPLFWRNNIINAWCISEDTIKSSTDDIFCTYNDYIIIVQDNKQKIKVKCNCCGGMYSYIFKNFFDYKDIENELDLEIQEKLLNKINYLIDEGILIK